MLNLLSVVSIILLIAAALTKLIEVHIDRSKKEQIIHNIESTWIRIDDAQPAIIVQVPLRLFHTVLETFLGHKVFSKKAFFRASIMSLAILFSSLGVTGILTHTTFGISTPPWNYFDGAIEKEKKLNEYRQKQSTAETDSDESSKQVQEYEKRRWEMISKFDTPEWRYIYTILFIVFVLAINTFFDYISLAITHLMLREMIAAESFTLVVSILLINLLIAFFLSTFVLISVILATEPFVVDLLLRVIPYFLVKYPSWTAIGIFASAIGAWHLSAPWFKVFALTTIFPSLFLTFILLFCLLLHPVRTRIYSVLNRILLHAVEYEKGLFSYVVIILMSVGGIIGGICKLF